MEAHTAHAAREAHTSEPAGCDAPSDVWREVAALGRRLQELAGSYSGAATEAGERADSAEPDVDLAETPRDFQLFIPLPGADPHRLTLEATRTSLNLVAPRTASSLHDLPPGDRLRSSRHSAATGYRLSLRLPAEITPEAVAAEYRHGMLHLVAPKANVTAEPVKVRVRVAGEAAPDVPDEDSVDPSADADREAAPAARADTRAEEGHASRKLGLAYTRTASEDHITQAQFVGARTEGLQQPPGPSPVSAGYTNPLAVPEPETDRPSEGTSRS